MNTTDSAQDTDPRARFSEEFMADIYSVLGKHGYRRPEGEPGRARSHHESLAALRTLVLAFEGRSTK